MSRGILGQIHFVRDPFWQGLLLLLCIHSCMRGRWMSRQMIRQGQKGGHPTDYNLQKHSMLVALASAFIVT